MLKVSGVSKAFGDQMVLKDISFILNEGERIGLVGSNGCGKTTLLEIIRGVLKPDSGSVWIDPTKRIGYVPQSLMLDQFDAWTVGNFLTNHDSIESEPEQIVTFRKSLSKLNLGEIDWNQPIRALSGGERSRFAIASALATDPDVLLLDEPTNNLDLGALAWFETFLRESRKSLIIVSHDRWFLDQIVTKILEIDQFAHNVSEFIGTYSDFVIEVRKRREKQHLAHIDCEKKVRRLKDSIQRQKQWAASAAQREKPKDSDKLSRNFRKNRSIKIAGGAKRLEHQLNQLEKVEDVRERSATKVRLLGGDSKSINVLRVENLGYQIGKYPLFANLQLSVRSRDRIAIMGDNGVGKTTLLRILIGELLPLSGSVKRNANIQIEYLPQDRAWVNPDTTPFDWLRQFFVGTDTELRHLLAQFHFLGDDIFKKVSRLSYGEQTKLRLAKIVALTPDLLVLDEPTNHLDTDTLTYVEEQLSRFSGTTIVVSHDRYFLREIQINKFFLLQHGGDLVEYNYLEEILAIFS